jgi:hypothetical protein
MAVNWRFTQATSISKVKIPICSIVLECISLLLAAKYLQFHLPWNCNLSMPELFNFPLDHSNSYLHWWAKSLPLHKNFFHLLHATCQCANRQTVSIAKIPNSKSTYPKACLEVIIVLTQQWEWSARGTGWVLVFRKHS